MYVCGAIQIVNEQALQSVNALINTIYISIGGNILFTTH
jgi:hypothetical protein